MTPDAVIFDFDGVLANSEPLHLRVYQELLAAEGIVFTAPEYYDRYLGFDDVGVFEALARDKGLEIGNGRLAELIERKTSIFQAIIAGGSVLFSGAEACVRAVAAVCPVAIASGALRHEIELILDGAGLSDAFPVIVAAGETPNGKPAPDPYVKALALLESRSQRPLAPARSIAIEDSQWGLVSARAAGLRTLGLATSYPAEALTHADTTLPDIRSVTVERLALLVSSPQVEA